MCLQRGLTHPTHCPQTRTMVRLCAQANKRLGQACFVHFSLPLSCSHAPLDPVVSVKAFFRPGCLLCAHSCLHAPPRSSAAVVGAGPSGSVCGYFLARGGAKVAVLDKETFPRDK